MIKNSDIKTKSKDYSLYTWSSQRTINTIAVKNAQGCYYWDYEGKQYFDLCSQLACVNIGHGNDEVIKAIVEQANELSFVKPKFTTRIRGEVSELIINEFAPYMSKILYSTGGAESNEYALRMAQVYTGRKKVFSQYNSYHGSTYGAACLSGDISRGNPVIKIPGFMYFWGENNRLIDHENDEHGDSEYYLKLLDKQLIYENPSEVACIFLETIPGGNSLVMSSKKYLQGVRKMCDKYGILLIVDEVLTGFGRTGYKFAVDYYGIRPDMITFSKGVTSAYLPLGGVIVNESIADFFDTHGVPVGCTYNSHPLCLAAAKANLEVIIKNKLIENCMKMGEILEQGLNEVAKKHYCIEERRGIGLLQGLKVKDAYTNTNFLSSVFKTFAQKGYPTNGNQGNILFSPPFIVSEEEINRIIEVADEVLSYIE